MKQTTDNSEANKLHKNIFCDGCHKEIRGRRYKCLVCTDFDLCHLCEQKNEHFGHAMMRLVTPKTLLPDFVKAQFEDHHFKQQKPSTSQQGTLNQKKSVVKPKKKKSPKKIPPKKIIQKITTRKITLPTTMRICKRSNIKEEPVSDVLQV
uniref:ZZ-type domain-containing protein n=1 Tax=Meloidogyne enterolobii TaxID=390850 RepID=A0A6V7ULH5_MELEN|nr:unnamed protein product [Meloidogyne enterolobii]